MQFFCKAQPFSFRDRLYAARRLGILAGASRLLAGLCLGDIEGHSKHCKGAHGLSPSVRLPRRLA